MRLPFGDKSKFMDQPLQNSSPCFFNHLHPATHLVKHGEITVPVINFTEPAARHVYSWGRCINVPPVCARFLFSSSQRSCKCTPIFSAPKNKLNYFPNASNIPLTKSARLKPASFFSSYSFSIAAAGILGNSITKYLLSANGSLPCTASYSGERDSIKTVPAS